MKYQIHIEPGSRYEQPAMDVKQFSQGDRVVVPVEKRCWPVGTGYPAIIEDVAGYIQGLVNDGDEVEVFCDMTGIGDWFAQELDRQLPVPLHAYVQTVDGPRPLSGVGG